MEPTSSLNCGTLSDLNGHYHSACGGASISNRHYNNPGRKRSKVRLNDQLIPKPTDINVAEKMIKVATPRQHPFSSHISQFAMFPSYRSPDYPETGVRAAAQPLLSPQKNVLTRPPEVILDGEDQVFYPTPPKTVSSKPKLKDFDLSLSQRTSNMLKNVERTRWVTSYQMHYTGSGPANPLKIGDFNEKTSDLTGMYSHSAPVVQGSEMSPQVLHRQHTETKSFACEGRERENCTVQFDESPMQVSRSSREANAAWTADNHPLSQGEMEANGEKSLIKLRVKDDPRREKEHFKAGRKYSISQSDVAEDLTGIESHAELLSRAASEQERVAKGEELPCSLSNPCILPRPPVLPGIRPMDSAVSAGREAAALSLLDLQNTFSKSMVHHNFNSSITRAAVNLRDNVVTGKKHDFFGINSYYLHG